MSIKRDEHMVKLRLSGRKLADLDFWTKSDPFLTLSRPNRAGTGMVQVRKTETVMNNLNPDWRLLYIPLSELCDGDYNMVLQIAVYDEDKSSRHDLIGTVDVTLDQLLQCSRSSTSLPLVRERDGIHKRKEGRGDILVSECSLEDPGDPLRKTSVPGSYPAPNSLARSYPAPAPAPAPAPDINSQSAPYYDPSLQDQTGVPGYPQPSIPGPPGYPQQSIPGPHGYPQPSIPTPQWAPVNSYQGPPSLYPELPIEPEDGRPVWVPPTIPPY